MLANVFCSIVAVNAGSDGLNPPNLGVTLNLTDKGGTFNDVTFMAADIAKREILAVALTAISTGRRTAAVVDAPTGGGTPTCYNLRIVTV